MQHGQVQQTVLIDCSHIQLTAVSCLSYRSSGAIDLATGKRECVHPVPLCCLKYRNGEGGKQKHQTSESVKGEQDRGDKFGIGGRAGGAGWEVGSICFIPLFCFLCSCSSTCFRRVRRESLTFSPSLLFLGFPFRIGRTACHTHHQTPAS